MENKYFTPSIEDIRIGYECEAHLLIIERVDKWIPIKFKGVCEDVRKYHSQGVYRTLYLTKEQIEEEGWEFKQTNKIRDWYEIESPEDGGNWYGYYIYKAQLIYDEEMKLMKISFCFDCTTWETVFEGECKCINTLRSVMRLLRMKIKK